MRIVRWIVVGLSLALVIALASPTTAAQEVPTLVDGVWLLPEPESAGMGPDPQWGSSYEQTAYEACAVHGCDGDYLITIMNCESGQDPGAWHPNPYGGADVGIMQINDATWGSIAYAGPHEQIWWAAEKIAAGYGSIWSCG